MPQTTINYPPRAQNALADRAGWTATIPDPANPTTTIPNPTTKGQAVDAYIKAMVKTEANEYRRAVARKASDAATPDDDVT